ncbi:MAG: alpha-N-acetylglucosaminidase, partial [Bacteroidales bacterium]|nr:alpha-N-acetylglucosaminidase [Bacteroidales bacterium]
MNLRRLSIKLLVLVLVIFGLIQISCTSTDKIDNQDYTSYDKAMRSLAHRLLSDNASLFRFRVINDADNIKNDAFEIDSEEGKITISGNNTVAIASGLNWYLKNYCHCQVSLNYNQLDLPDPLPVPEEKIRIETPFKYRYFFNYCTYGYSMPWWDWEKWEEVIDYMALMGINMPLAPIGQEAIWEEVYKDLGLSDKQLDEFFVGPAHLPWGRMGNIDGLGGPLPQNWIKLRKELQKKILNRMRSYGMKPVLQGFTGHVPKELKDIYPNADIEQINDWAGIPGTMFLSPTDSLFAYIGKSFIERQTETYGTDHLYDADCFIEVDPPSKDPEYLAGVSKAVYESMASADPDAIWVMQGWFFFFKKDFWQTEQGRAFVGAVPENKLIVLDLYGEKNTTWDKTEAFFGQPWIWNVICNEDQKVNMSGDLQQMQINFDEAFRSEINNNLVGVGT